MSYDVDPLGQTNLLEEYALDVQKRQFRRRLFAGGLPALLLVAAIVEPFAFNSTHLLANSLILVGVAISLGLCLLYASVVFYLGWSYAAWVQDRGQTRPSAIQIGVIVLIASGVAIMMSFFMRSDRIDPVIAGVIGFLTWTNLSAGLLGYGAEFLSRRVHKR